MASASLDRDDVPGILGAVALGDLVGSAPAALGGPGSA